MGKIPATERILAKMDEGVWYTPHALGTSRKVLQDLFAAKKVERRNSPAPDSIIYRMDSGFQYKKR